MALESQNIQIRPMRVTFGEDRAQTFTISCGPDVAQSLDNKYFFLYDEDATTTYYAWFNNTLAASGVDPAIPGATGIQVDFETGDDATAIATAVASAIGAEADFSASSSTSLVTVTNAAAGLSRAPHNGDLLAGDQFSFKVTLPGSSAEEVGFVDGEITVTTGEELLDVSAHQTGATNITNFVTGRTMEVAVTLKETSKAQLKRMMVLGGGDSTSGDGASGTEVFGYGTDKLFANTFNLAQKMVMHPAALPCADVSEDFVFCKAYPMIEDLTFSGEEVFTIPVTFKIYPDFTKPGAMRYMFIGDSNQTFTLGDDC